MSLDIARQFKSLVERLNAAVITGQAVDTATATAIAQLSTTFAEKLAIVGLIQPRRSTTLGPFLLDYAEKRTDVKSATKINWGHTKRNLVTYFGEGKPLREITKGDAADWRRWLESHEKLSPNTVNKRCGNAKQFFSDAVDHQLIESNPFGHLTSVVRGNPKRFYFITRAEADKVIEACPDAQWRLLFALSRFGGLRCPSEHLSLRWTDVDWDRGRLRVPSPKTEHHEGREDRIIPLFPELRPHLEAVFDLAKEGSEFIITRYRHSTVNLRTQLIRIITQAGLIQWPKLWQNLRSTCQTELQREFSSHVVCKWIGNSQDVAIKHYLQVTDDDYEKALHNPVQQDHAMPRNESHASSQEVKKTRECESLRISASDSVGDTGLEPVTSAV